MIINNSNSVYFQGRCPAIRDSQWVIHTIQTKVPHFSSSKFQPLFVKFIQSKPKIIPNAKEITTNEQIWMKITPEMRGHVNMSKLSTIEKIKTNIKKFLQSSQTKKDIAMIDYIYKKICSVDSARKVCYGLMGGRNIYNILRMLEECHLGNCSENAKLAELILRMNGIENACTALLKSGNTTIDHLVCVFNKDGSRFRKKITNSTIIIDPWAQKADFAKNMMIYYKNMMSKSLNYIQSSKNIHPDINISLEKYERMAFSQRQLEEFRKTYPQFLFPNTHREFMKK